MILSQNMKNTFCYLCLAAKRRTLNIYKTDLQYIYESLAHYKIRDSECWMCYICHTRLQQCLRLQQLAVQTRGLIDGQNKINIDLKVLGSLLELSMYRTKNNSISHSTSCDIQEPEAKNQLDLKLESTNDSGFEQDKTQEHTNYAAVETFHIEFEDPLLVKRKVSRKLVDNYGSKQNNGARHESDTTPCANQQAIEHVEIKQEIEDLGMEVIEQDDAKVSEYKDYVSKSQASGHKTLSRKIQKLGGNEVQCVAVENIEHVTIQENHIHSQQFPYEQNIECITPEVILQRSTENPGDGFVRDQTQENAKYVATDTCPIEFEGPLLRNDGGSKQHNGARHESDTTPCANQQAIEHVEIKQEIEDLGMEENEQATNVSEEQSYISQAQASAHNTLSSDICWEPFTSTSQQQHSRTHSGDKRFSCNICSKEYSQKHNLIKHILTHGDYKPFSCNICSKRFYQKENLDTHMRIHGDVKTVFKCDVCEKTFAHKRTLDNHKETHSNERKFSCEVCFKDFFLKRVLKAHMRTHTNEKQFSCEICDKKFSVRDYMLKHMKTHTGEKPYTCHICQKPFSEKGTLNAHIYTHTGDKPFDCNMCSKKFSLKSTLKSHILVHIGEKPFACTYCGKKFREQKSLNRHMKNHLNSEKSFICDMCSRTFASKSTLKSHMLVHVGDKPYSCDTCGNKFREQKALNRHIKSHIGEMVPIEKPFSCGTCGNKYKEHKIMVTARHLKGDGRKSIVSWA